MPACAGQRQLSPLLRVLAAELGRMGRDFHEIERVVLNILKQDAMPDFEMTADVQKLDVAMQEMAALEEFLVQLAKTVPDDWLVDAGLAAQNIRLASLARRLQSPVQVGELMESVPDDNRIELF